MVVDLLRNWISISTVRPFRPKFTHHLEHQLDDLSGFVIKAVRGSCSEQISNPGFGVDLRDVAPGFVDVLSRQWTGNNVPSSRVERGSLPGQRPASYRTREPGWFASPASFPKIWVSWDRPRRIGYAYGRANVKVVPACALLVKLTLPPRYCSASKRML